MAFGDFLGGVLGLIGAGINSSATQRANTANIQAQERMNNQMLAFSQREANRDQNNFENLLQTRKNDAVKAGFSPLAALGNTGSSTTVSSPALTAPKQQADTSFGDFLQNYGNTSRTFAHQVSMTKLEQKHDSEMADKLYKHETELAELNNASRERIASSQNKVNELQITKSFEAKMAEIDESIRKNDWQMALDEWHTAMEENDAFPLNAPRYYSAQSWIVAYKNWYDDYSNESARLREIYNIQSFSESHSSSLSAGGNHANASASESSSSSVGSAYEAYRDAMSAWVETHPIPVPGFRIKERPSASDYKSSRRN